MATKAIKRGMLWLLVIFSVVSLFFTPLDSILDKILMVLPWVGPGLIATEVLFIIGLGIMATSIGLRIRNPLKLRKELGNILREATDVRTFWVGFWINAIGAAGSCLLVCIALFVALPITSWGLAYIPLADLVATLALRAWIIRASTHEHGPS
jgi:hypothetical protein